MGANVLVPDLVGWHRADFTALDLRRAHLTEPPTWLCEVLSPSTQALDRVRKMRVYGRHGVRWVWLLDPVGRSLEVFRNDDGQWRLVATFDPDDPSEPKVEPFDTFSLPLGELWSEGPAPSR